MESKVFIFTIILLFLPAVSCQVTTPQPSSSIECEGDEFACMGECISSTKKCDGVIDCVDGSDEIDCYNQTCRGNQFQCSREGRCIPHGLVCNGFWDCTDGSDEQQCDRQLACPHGEWSCPGSDSRCVSLSRLCDGNSDCTDGADEQIPCSNLRCGILSCTSDCRVAPGGGICVCPQGYALTNDSRTCGDLDECLSFGYCDQECSNTEGSYSCSCTNGYSMNSRSHCMATGSQSAFLIYTHGRDVLRTTLVSGDTPNRIGRSTRAYTLDYHWRQQKVFWSDVWAKTVYSVPLTGGDVTTFEETIPGFSSFDSMAVDWIADKIYVLEYYTRAISVMEMSGSNRARLITSDLQPISGLAIDPTEGYMFFSYRGDNARLVKAYMDGSHVMNLVTDYIFSVTGITADIPAKRIYWVDSMLDYLESVRYDGRSRQIVSVGFDVLPHPTGVSVFEEYAYACDQTKRGLVKLNRFDRNPRGTNLLHSVSTAVRKLKVVHPSLQPVVDNPCGSDNGGCSHLCVLSHITDSNGIGYRCKCPMGMQLNQDERTCTDITRILLYQSIAFIRGVPLDSDFSEDVIEPIPVYLNMRFTFDAARRRVIYGQYNNIIKVNLDGSGYHQLPWSEMYRVDSLAYDWLADNLYFTDAFRRVVAVVKLSGSFNGSRDLVSDLAFPGLVAVAPVDGYLFFAEREPRIAKIERGWLDGSHRMVLVDTLIGLPWELVVDQEENRIYWIDSVLKKIERIDFTGQNRVALNIQQMGNPTGLALFGEYLLYGDRRSLAIARVSKEDGSQYHIIRDNLRSIEHIAVMDEDAQTGSNTCSNSGGMCSHFCFATPDLGRSCGCPYGLKLDSNHMTCIDNSDAEPPTSCPYYMVSCDNGQRCYYSWELCDGLPSCQDGSDETDCEACNRYSFTCQDGTCIDSSSRCDHHLDCEDGSDEEGCFQASCEEGEFECANGKCIPPHLKCNTENNCGDASDEMDCEIHDCGEGMFSCASHLRCVSLGVVCDGESDCGDGSDERDCEDTSCSSENRWQCANGQCIVAVNLCDRFWDCDDHSDEDDCPTILPGECEEGQFLCQLDEECIPSLWECDGHRDCSDFSDEHDDCPPVTCTAELFQCDNNLCIPKWEVCNGNHDCGDGTDEEDCTPPPFQCYSHQYQCFETETCIEVDQVCNGETDCPDGDDESSLCNSDTCNTLNGGCEQICYTSPFGAMCDCEDGYKKNGTKRCDDVNECDTGGICSQSCTNTAGSYVCSCTVGYSVVNNGRCVHSDPAPPKLIVSSYYRITSLEIETGFSDTLVRWDTPYAVEWDIEDNFLFWSDWSEDAIFRSNGTTNEKIISGGVGHTESIAVDWVGRHIYWMDYFIKAIEVSNMDGSDRIFLLTLDRANPRGLALDPRDGKHLLFWTDWSQNAVIERVDMDGHNRRVIVSENLYWVNGLTADLPAERLFYADARLDYIASCDYEGGNIQVMEILELIGSHVHSLTVFEDWLYWTDRTHHKVMKVEKFSGRNATVAYTVPWVLDVHAKHPALQPPGTNYCENSPCQGLCLLSTTDPFYSCRCPVGKVLSEDGVNCTDSGASILFLRSSKIWSSWLDINNTDYSTVPVIDSSLEAFDVDFDLRDGYIYWTDSPPRRQGENTEIHRVLMTGSNKTNFVPSAYYGRSYALAIDWITRNLFWTNSVRNSIEVIRMDGEPHHRTTVISKTPEVDIGDPMALCLDPFKGKLFWADNGGVGVHQHIASAFMDGTNYRKLIVDQLSTIGGLTIDIEAARLYWSDTSHQKVESCQLDGSDRRQVIGDLHNPRGLTIYGSHLYFVDSNLQQVIRVDKSTGQDQFIYRHNMWGVRLVKIMARPPGEVNSCSENNGGCTHLCLPVGPTSRVCKCSMGYQLNADRKTCGHSTTFLVVAQLHVIRGYTLDANDHHDAMVPVGGSRYVLSVDVLPEQQWVYFVEHDSSYQRRDAIRRVHPSGSEIEDIITGGIGHYGLRGMAIDWVAGNLYFSNAFPLHTYLEVSRLNGTHRRIVYKTEDQLPRALAVNPIKRYLYFQDYGNNPHIGRLDLDGENHTSIARVGVQITIDLCIDLSTHQVYWTDKIAGTIERTEWDGSNRQIFRSNLANPMGITVYQNQVLWVDRTVKKVYSIDKTASENDDPTVLKEDLLELRDIVPYDRLAKPEVQDHPCGGESYGGCQQLCFANPQGSQVAYTCACSFGELNVDGKTCNSSDKFLLYATYYGIKSHSLDDSNQAQPIPSPVQGSRTVGQFDYDYKEGKIFYIINYYGIQVVSIHGNSGDTTQEPALIYRGYMSNIRVDYIHRLLYWNARRRIYTANFDGSNQRSFSVGSRSWSIRFEISPCHGYIFSLNGYYTSGAMTRSSLRGRQREVIANFENSRRDYFYFTLDSPAQMIYRVRRSSHTLERFDFDGNNLEVISTSFFGGQIVVSGDFLFAQYSSLRGIVRIEKDSAAGYSVLFSYGRETPRYIQVYEDRNQQCSASDCDIFNGGCSHTCLRGPNGGAECTCPADYRLVNKRRMCLPTSVSRCQDGQFTCENGQCIPMRWTCDIDDDCGDMSDENDTFCFDHQCEGTDFTCSNGRCIHPQWLCDYDNDCRDGSDEIDCPFPTCDPASDFTCLNSRCISREHVCDGIPHCFDETASDEQGCVNPEPCPTDWTRCSNNNLCIHITYRCDGDNDCLDNSDENPFYCVAQPCDPPYWRCPSGRCIPGSWYCDGDDDCGDLSDEPQDTCETDTFTCVEGYFTCANGRCIVEQWKCDTDNDCGDGSDESEDLNCDEHTCQEDLYFTCTRNRPGTSRCIPLDWVCDGESDCEQAEDEDGCARRSCPENQFVCDNGLCIPEIWKCDHDNDCGDQSDEPPQCDYRDCDADEFLCQNGRCIPLSWKCDGDDDCRDNSDEADNICNTAPPTCPPNNFRCTSGTCIAYELVCNKATDCEDESDEEHCDVNECASITSNQCEHSCVNTLTSFYCTCEEGNVLNSDQRTCRDIDECTETPWVCSQICENLPGSYLCKCAEGYLREPDGTTCKHESDEEPVLLFSNRYYVRKLKPDGSEYDLIADGFTGAVGLDYDLQAMKIYLIDVTDGSIVKMNMDGSGQEKIIVDFIYGGEGLAVDWVGRKLYFVDRYRDVMEVAEMDGSYRKTLIHQGLFEPRAVAVDPKHGIVYWTDWGLEAYIGRRGMDGSDAGGNIRDEKIVWPNGLAIDFAAEKIFWCDAHLDFIAYSDLDGDNMHELPGQPGAEVAHPFAVTVFEDWVYWTDWNVKGVYKAKKFSGEEQELLVSSHHRPHDIHVMHSALQEDLPNPCGTNNGGCSHLCLIAYNGTSFQCACPDNFVLQPDGLTCFPNCSVQEYRCIDNSKCIPFFWKCDGNADCKDGSDEPANCPVRHCYARQFQCDNLNCTTAVQLCNGEDDCGDHSDEKHCDATTCKPWEFRCATGSCISHQRVCNQRDDCPDGSDENQSTCQAIECSAGYFKCGNGYCIPGAWVCDLDNDCGDGSDEIHRDCQARTCEAGWYNCRTNYRCIPSWAVCNGYDNCRDNSDEESCEVQECGSGEFRCDNHRCIPLRWQCDFVDDCRDNSDEERCIHRECSESEFRCLNNQCISSRFVCDQYEDCDTGEDELSCENQECQSDQFQCTSGHCISQADYCDGEAHCNDFSDELNCPTRLPGGGYCFASQFTCNNTICIPRSYVCDGWDDCGDNSDESRAICAVATCDPENRFHCDNQICIPLWLTCNGVDNCQDASDENSHGLCDPAPCSDDQFTCENQKCIAEILVCDSFDDCGDESDERGCNLEGSCNTANCQQKCTDLTGGYICSCEKGYKRGEVTHLCEDINECDDNPCMQECRNSKGSYMCSCIDGYQDHDIQDGQGCKADEESRPWILFGDGTELRYYDTRTKTYNDVVYGEGKIQSLDFRTDTGAVYWTDTSLKVIKRVRLPDTGGSQQSPQVVVTSKEADRPEGIAIDWVGGNLYWTDLGSLEGSRTARDVDLSSYNGPRISVSKLDGRYIKVLIKDDLPSLGYITVSPRKGVMYWTQSGNNAKLETAWMDGSHRTVLATDLLEPSGLAVDYSRYDCLYFCDRKLNRIEVINWDGTGRKLLREGGDLGNPFLLEVFETLLYWSSKSYESFESNNILQMNKLGSGIPVNTLSNLIHPTGVKLYHKLRYDIGDYNPCQEGYCSHLCLLTPLRDGNNALRGYQCACPEGDMFEPRSNSKCQGAVVEARTFPPREICSCINGGTCLSDGTCQCPDGWSGPDCSRKSEKQTASSAGAAVGVTFAVLIMLALVVVAAFFVLKNLREKKEDEVPVTYRDGKNIDLPLGAVEPPANGHTGTNGTSIPGNFENPMYGLQTAELQAVGFDDEAAPLPEKTGLPPDVVQDSPIPLKSDDVVVTLPSSGADITPPSDYNPATYTPTEEEGDTNVLVTKD